MSELCIYHGNCADGFGAAWAVRRALGDQIGFHAGTYGNPPPDVAGRAVVMVDFSYPRQVLLEMAEQAKSIIILDHHKTAAEQLVSLPTNVVVRFDMERSGAMLAWEHFFPNEAPPPLLLHIEDRDLWRFALANTREIQANVFSYPYDFQVWDELMATDVAHLVTEGRAIERKHHKDIAELVRVAGRKMVIGGVFVPTCNLPYTMASDAGLMLAEWGRCEALMHADVLCMTPEEAAATVFGATYYDTVDHRIFSLRSLDDGADVALIAQQYGGGGHKHASGFRVPRDSILGRS